MSSKTQKKVPGRGNGTAKRSTGSGRFVSRTSVSKAAALTERAWRKTYENRGRSKARA